MGQLSFTARQAARRIIDMQSINRFFYGPTPEERVRAWQTKLRAESRQLDREMRQVGSLHLIISLQHHDDVYQLEMSTSKARQSVKQLASKGDVKSARILAREVVRSDKQRDRMSVSKARLGSIGTQLTQQMGELLQLVQDFEFSHRRRKPWSKSQVPYRNRLRL